MEPFGSSLKLRHLYCIVKFELLLRVREIETPPQHDWAAKAGASHHMGEETHPASMAKYTKRSPSK